MTPAAPQGNELYFLSFRITSRYIVTLDCTCNVRQKSNGLLKSSQSDDVKSLWISYHSIVSDGIGNGEKPSISKHFLASGVTSRWLIGSTPKRQVGGSNPLGCANKVRCASAYLAFFTKRIQTIHCNRPVDDCSLGRGPATPLFFFLTKKNANESSRVCQKSEWLSHSLQSVKEPQFL